MDIYSNFSIDYGEKHAPHKNLAPVLGSIQIAILVMNGAEKEQVQIHAVKSIRVQKHSPNQKLKPKPII